MNFFDKFDFLDEVAYITRLGDNILDEETLKKSKVFIVNAFPEMVLDQELRFEFKKSLKKNQIKTYYLPLDYHVKLV